MIIETYIIDYLQKKTGVSCYAQYDDASQDTFIVVEKDKRNANFAYF